MAETSQAEHPLPSRRTALLALLLIAPVPSIGTAIAMLVEPGTVGNIVFVIAKVWLLCFPAAWWFVVERGRFSLSPPRMGGLWVGAGLGLAIAVVIAAAFYLFAADRIDVGQLRQVVVEIELGSPLAFAGGAAYWIFVNSLIEEYVYRWFVLRQCRALLSPTWAIGASAAVFTAHHVIALSVYLDPMMTALASLGVFVGGAVWSWLYLRYRSIWPPWVSHVAADVAIFVIGWRLLFA